MSTAAFALSLPEALTLDDAHLVEVQEADVIILGFPDEALAATGPDAMTLAGALATRFPDKSFLATASFAQDFPYNIARRIASLSALTGGRIGLALVAAATPFPTLRAGSPQEVLEDGIAVIRKLWESWPLDAVVADRERRLFVESERIRLVDHANIWSVRGPLQVPVDAARLPPIACWGHGGELDLTGFDRDHRAGPLGGDDAEGPGLRALLGLAPAPRALTDRTPAFEGKARLQ